MKSTAINIFNIILMHDPQYRLDVAMQTHGYIQSNHLSFYLGAETTFPIPKPNINYVTTTTVISPTAVTAIVNIPITTTVVSKRIFQQQ
ncbi:MAG: hypothetical protein QXV82_06400 [Ignisphaera sp.]